MHKLPISKNSPNAYRVKYSPPKEEYKNMDRAHAPAPRKRSVIAPLLHCIRDESLRNFISRVSQHNVASLAGRLLQCSNAAMFSWGDKSLLYRSLTADDGRIFLAIAKKSSSFIQWEFSRHAMYIKIVFGAPSWGKFGRTLVVEIFDEN